MSWMLRSVQRETNDRDRGYLRHYIDGDSLPCLNPGNSVKGEIPEIKALLKRFCNLFKRALPYFTDRVAWRLEGEVYHMMEQNTEGEIIGMSHKIVVSPNTPEHSSSLTRHRPKDWGIEQSASSKVLVSVNGGHIYTPFLLEGQIVGIHVHDHCVYSSEDYGRLIMGSIFFKNRLRMPFD